MFVAGLAVAVAVVLEVGAGGEATGCGLGGCVALLGSRRAAGVGMGETETDCAWVRCGARLGLGLGLGEGVRRGPVVGLNGDRVAAIGEIWLSVRERLAFLSRSFFGSRKEVRSEPRPDCGGQGRGEGVVVEQQVARDMGPP